MAATSPTVIRVALDGSGDFCTVQDAVDAVPPNNKCRTIIRLSPGVYKQPIYIPSNKNFITFAALSPEVTVISWNNTAANIEHHEASLIGTGTSGCGSVIIKGKDFIAENVTFENSAPQGSEQAVAVRVDADRCAFYNCRFLGWQDTLYLHNKKQYLKDCYIEGSVDFIFGNGTVLLEHCHIHCKADGFITAQSRKESEDTTAFVFLRCVITGNGKASYMYLGRPWKPFGRVVFAHTYIDQCVRLEGWHNWDNCENEKSACFYEYRCYGPGSCRSERVEWGRELIDEEADQFLVHSFIDPDPENLWLDARMGIRIPHSA